MTFGFLVAWYTADANATAKSAAGTGGALTSTASSISAGDYIINFVVSPNTQQLQLSHVANSTEATDGVNGIAAADLNSGDLIYGVISNNTANMRKVAAADKASFVGSYTVSASWATKPSNPADIAYLSSGLSFTVATGVTGTGNQARLLNKNDVTGLTESTSGSVTFDITYASATDTWTFTAAVYVNNYVHIEPAHLDATETGTEGAITIAADQVLTLSATPDRS